LNNLLCFLSEHGVDDQAGSMVKVVSELRDAKLKAKKYRTNIMQYF